MKKKIEPADMTLEEEKFIKAKFQLDTELQLIPIDIVKREIQKKQMQFFASDYINGLEEALKSLHTPVGVSLVIRVIQLVYATLIILDMIDAEKCFEKFKIKTKKYNATYKRLGFMGLGVNVLSELYKLTGEVDDKEKQSVYDNCYIYCLMFRMVAADLEERIREEQLKNKIIMEGASEKGKA